MRTHYTRPSVRPCARGAS